MSHHIRGRSALRAAVLFLAAGLALGAVGCSGDTGKDKRDGSKKDPVGGRPEREWAVDKKGEGEHDTEQYGRIVDNDFLSPAQTPLSTLSVDVDTASYSNVRSFLDQGRLPPRDAVRIEELVNYFPYAYPAPVDGRPVSLTADLAVCPWNDKHRLVRVGLRGRSVDPRQMPRRNFVFLVDTSGSMSQPNRLPLLQASLRLLAEGLTAQDRVALVAYAGSAGLVLPSTRGDDRRTILAAVDRLQAGGSTNGG